MILRILAAFMLTTSSYAQTLTIATTADNPPFSSKADQKNHFYGFDLDLMTEVCKRIKVKCNYTNLGFDNLFAAVNNKQIDLAISSIIITPDRQLKYLFSLPYLASHVQFVSNQHTLIDSPDDIKNKRVGVRRGTPFMKFAQMLYQNQVTVTEYSYIPDLFQALSTNTVDVILIDKDAAQYWYANNSTLYKLIGPPVPFGGGYGIMTKLGGEALIKEVNSALLQMEADGTYLKLYTRYFN